MKSLLKIFRSLMVVFKFEVLTGDNVISLKFDEKIEQAFRQKIGQTRGVHKGNLRTALQEAMLLWIKVYGNNRSAQSVEFGSPQTAQHVSNSAKREYNIG